MEVIDTHSLGAWALPPSGPIPNTVKPYEPKMFSSATDDRKYGIAFFLVVSDTDLLNSLK